MCLFDIAYACVICMYNRMSVSEFHCFAIVSKYDITVIKQIKNPVNKTSTNLDIFLFLTILK